MTFLTRHLERLPFRHKIVLHAMITSGMALLLACIAILIHDSLELQRRAERRVGTEADLLAANCAADLAFQDAQSAKQTLAGLAADPNVTFACLYRKDGTAFAHYARRGEAHEPPPVPEEIRPRYAYGSLELFRPVMLEQERIGTIYIRYDLAEIYHGIVVRIMIIVAVLLGALLLAFALSAGFVNTLSRPVLSLVETARTVSHTRDYSLRAVRYSRDELGHLTDAFNEMLARIQEQDAALKTAKEELESRIEERTRDLSVEKERAESNAHRLQEQTQLLSNILATIPQRVFWKDKNGVYLGCNETFARDAGLASPTEVLGKTDRDFATIADKVEQFRETDRRVVNSGEPILNYEETLRGRGGNEFTLLTSKVPLRDASGSVIGVLGVCSDITERKNAEKEREGLHAQLVAASRQAGMADVATGVLHNVGNVLNSLNISASLVREHVRRLKTAEFRKALDLAQQHKDRLADFIQSHEQGKRLFPYLTELARYFCQEQQMLLNELRTLDESAQHVMRVIQMQQSFARASGVSEPVNLPELLDDALRMHEASLKRHGIEVVREYANAKNVILDKHKFLQIILNLVSNAKHALRDATRKHKKKMFVRCAEVEGDRVRVEVQDNGVGIPAENMRRIFNYGFTTKKKGHGFGLHSGAVVAQELGGSLIARSDGAGKGARFILEIPVIRKHQHPRRPGPRTESTRVKDPGAKR